MAGPICLLFLTAFIVLGSRIKERVKKAAGLKKEAESEQESLKVGNAFVYKMKEKNILFILA